MPSSDDTVYRLVSLSPQIPQANPSIGRIAVRQDSQTGKREIRTRGSPHNRQSEGNRVVNRLSAIAFSRKSEGFFSDGLLTSRIRSPLLLKTNLPRPDRAPQASLGGTVMSIKVRRSARNRRRRGKPTI